ncbi:MAG: hypothetical protein KDA80_15235, partial [Planctomycetaceae bacterium]|nr:hypothetical protein [Planctomycetaceae bacterium]
DDSPQIAPPPPRTSQTPNEQASTPSNLPFIILASYASLVTLLLLMQFFSGGGAPNTKQLESLPDVAPEAPDKLSFISPDKPLPPGHTLTIGTEQRFGHILVEPLRVVHEPIEFVHYSDPSKTREPSQAVCKLWVRFTNVSDDQVISPLDAKLLLRWVVNSQLGERSNYYIAEPHGVATQATTYQYRLSKVDSWDMKGQSLGKELGPGETWETYICSEEIRLEELPESMVWRFQIRKGFSPKNHGVTTMVEVPFSKSDLG